jgi:hypothetical protein
VEITIQQISDAPSGDRYYAWLQVNGEGITPINWPLTTHNGSISSPAYQNTHLLTNKPDQLLITLENIQTVSVFPSYTPSARRYYANLPGNIQSPATYDIRLCPQDNSSNVCYT